MPLREAGNGPPIFFIADADGETLLYRNLANLLDTRHPAFGLQPHVGPDGSVTNTTIPEMAAHYVRQIRAQAAHGPYVLSGLCAGGVIAFEVALQLQASGEDVALVALIDAVETGQRVRRTLLLKARLRRFFSAFERDSGVSLASHLWRAPLAAAAKGWRFVRYNLANWWTTRRKAHQIRKMRRGAVVTVAPVATPSIRDVYMHAMTEYTPGSRLRSDVILFRATVGDASFGAGDFTAAQAVGDPLLGWQQHVTQVIQAMDVAASHTEILQEPHVYTVGQTLQQAIDHALQEGRSAPDQLRATG